ncbi:MAG: type II secretion system F family protein [Myxococcota bacterium]
MNTMLIILVSALVFAGVLTATNLLYWSWRSRQEQKARELARRLGTVSDEPTNTLFVDQGADAWAEMLGSLGDQLEGLLKESGSEWTMSQLLGWSAAMAVIGMFTTTLILRGPVGIIGIILGAIPLVILSSRAEKRARQISEQLPDGLDLVARSLQAGHGLSDAMRMCAMEMPPPIAHEFGRVHEEHNLGRDFRECLSDLCKRNPRNFDLRLFVSSVVLQRDTGGNLIEILNNISGTIRARFVFERKVSALTAEAKISAMILGAMPFLVAILLMVIKPDYLSPFLTDPLGRMMLMFAVGCFSTGVLSMYYLSRVEV